MKPTQVAELLANIRKTFVSFFSILMFVALGVGIFLGISWAGPALQGAANDEFHKGALYHFQVQYLYGLTDDDLVKLSAVEGVSDVEPARQSFQDIEGESSQRLTVKVQSLPECINVPVVLEGSLPSRQNEIALNEVAAADLGFAVGDVITFSKDGDSSAESGAAPSGGSAQAAADDKDGMKYLNGSTYKVTALVESCEFLSKNPDSYGVSTSPTGMTNMLAWVPASAFDAAAYQNGYPIVNVVCDSLDALDTFSDEYKKASSEMANRIVALGDALAPQRYDDLHGQAKEKIDNAESQLNEGKQKISDGEQQLADGRAELETKEVEGRRKLDDAYAQLLDAENLKRQGEALVASMRDEVSQAEATLASAEEAKDAAARTVAEARAYKADQDGKLQNGEITQEEHDRALDDYAASVTAKLQPLADKAGATVPPITHENFDEMIGNVSAIVDNYENVPIEYKGQSMTVGEARAKLADAVQQLAYAESELSARSAQLEQGWSSYHAGEEEYARLVSEGEQKLAEGERELENAKAQVAENEPKLETAKSQYATMKERAWAVTDRSYNTGVVMVSMLSDMTRNLSFSMAALFIIVGLLVSYSAVSRIVHEQVTQIGTKKALGLRSREITLSFLLYSGLAVIAGAIIGAIVGYLIVEGIIGHVLAGVFAFGDYPAYFGLPLFIVVTALELVLVLGATYLACRSILKEHAVELLKGEKPPEGRTRFYEKWAIWNRLHLLTQTIVNNCVNDKRRVFSTVVGVAGCTALIVTAITLNDNVLKSYDEQYEDVYGFSSIVYADPSVEGAVDRIDATLNAKGASTASALRRSIIIDQPDGSRNMANILVPADADAFSDVYHVNVVSGEPFDASKDGLWMSQAYAEHFGVKPGDMLKARDTNGVSFEIPILGFHEYRLTSFEAVMGSKSYEHVFGVAATPNVVLAGSTDASPDQMRDALHGVSGYDSLVDDKKKQFANFGTFSSVSRAVVLIYIALSALMAIVVLLNLNVMFINEKRRELIVLMINGFSVKDAKRYIYNDTIVLTFIGVVCGLVLGCVMGSVTVCAIEPVTASFIKGIDWIAVAAGSLGSIVLSFIMSYLALRRIPKFNLTDINRF